VNVEKGAGKGREDPKKQKRKSERKPIKFPKLLKEWGKRRGG